MVFEKIMRPGSAEAARVNNSQGPQAHLFLKHLQSVRESEQTKV
jgi:hypothetical protein